MYSKAGPSETDDVDEKLPLSKALQGITFSLLLSRILFVFNVSLYWTDCFNNYNYITFPNGKGKKCIGLFFFNINELHKQNFSKPIFPFVNLVMNLEMGT